MSTPSPHHQDFTIPFPPKEPIKCITSAPSSPPSAPSLIFTHGAGGTLTSEAMQHFRTGFARHRSIACFQGNMNLGSRAKMFDAAASSYPETKCLGGRSMGARAAVMCANSRGKGGVEKLVLVSYPLHTGKGVRDRILLEIGEETDVLFVSGDGDAMCELERLEGVRGRMKARSWRIVVRGADHGMGVKPKKGTRDVGELVGEVVAGWLERSQEGKREGSIWWDGEEEKATWSDWVAGGEQAGKARSDEAKEVAQDDNASGTESAGVVTGKRKLQENDNTTERSSKKTKAKTTGVEEKPRTKSRARRTKIQDENTEVSKRTSTRKKPRRK